MLLAVVLLAGCSSDDENKSLVVWDISPVVFHVFITDSEGHDLLDSTYHDNIIKEVTATYQDETYPLTTDLEFYDKKYGKASTRAYRPTFYGLLLRPYWSHKTFTNNGFEITFGEFNGTENVDKREITLNMPYNQQLRLAYKNSFRWSNGDPDKKTVFYLNDQELTDEAGRYGYFNFRFSKTRGYEYIASEVK
jgi:hypothetical protein